jgi:hypothetical protein
MFRRVVAGHGDTVAVFRAVVAAPIASLLASAPWEKPFLK